MAEAATTFRERTEPYLRPNQIEEMEREQQTQRAMLDAPPFLRRGVDVKMATDTLRRIDKQLQNDAPRNYTSAEIDQAVAREKELREQWMAGMPTAAEMRRAPPGALEKHMSWERRNAKAIDEWKNIRLRLWKSGALPSEYEGSAISNIELYRPVGGPQELPMDNALIAGKQVHLGVGGAANSVTFTDREMMLIKMLAPDLLDRLALMSADERQEAKTALNALPPEPVVGERPLWERDNATLNELRQACINADIPAGGSKEELKAKLKQHHEAQG